MTHGIAIIGWSGRFPGASDVAQLWENLREGRESISFFTREELLAAGVDPALLGQPNYVPAAAVLTDADSFDHAFFGYSPREAEIMDPQQRLFLEACWSALEDAGYEPRSFSGRVGVWAGAGMNTYLLNNVLTRPDLLERVGPYQALIGSDKDFLATRVSYKLNLRGPSVTVQTACSTSLVAVAAGCQSLMNAECDLALAGGVTIRVPQQAGYLHQEEGILSPDGRCRPFDWQARGTVPGSGVAAVVLKRLEDAVADGDTIHAVIRGWAVNNDGSQKAGYTAPSVEGQSEAIVEAMALAEIEPESIGYIETHGTGTRLGDPIEITALTRAYRSQTPKRSFCAIGSIKSNFGHLDGAAGVAGLIKAALAVERGEIPATLHFQRPNPEIAFEDTPFFVNDALRDWKGNGQPRRAAVSSFGIGGTNAHVVLEQPPVPADSGDGPSHALIVLSAKSERALDSMTERLNEALARHPATSIHDVAFTLQVGRTPFEHRRFFVWSDASTASLTGGRSGVAPESRPSVAFLLPGQGAQYAAMGAELYEAFPIFREELDRCLEILGRLGVDLRAVLFSPGDERLGQTEFTQPALFAIEYALARWWMALGVQPEALVGHSVGEYVAACLSGVFSLEDALRLIALRGRLIQRLPAGSMLAVSMTEQDLRPLAGEPLAIAAVNAPAACTVSGPAVAIEELQKALESRGVAARALHTSHAFHSSMMEPMLAPFREEVARITLRAPRIPFVSNVTGTWITADQARDPEYWVSHVRQTVRFADGVAAALEKPDRILLEVGPGQALSSLARQHPAAKERVIVASMRHAQDDTSDVRVFLGALGSLWLGGVTPDWSALHRSSRRRRIPLPTYPFERVRHWIEPDVEGRPRRRAIYKRPQMTEWFYVPSWKRTAPLLARAGAPVAVVEDAAGLEALPDLPPQLVFDAQGEALPRLVAFIQALSHRARGATVQLAVVTRASRAVTGGEAADPRAAAIFGLCKVIPQEYPNIRCRAIDLEPDQPVDVVFDELQDGKGEGVVAYRGGHRWVERFEPVALEWPEILPDGSHVLITGGGGRFGTAAAEHFQRTRQANVSIVDVSLGVDVTDRAAMRRAIAEATDRFGPVDVVIHAAAVRDDGQYRTLSEETPAGFERHLAPKLEGLRVLDELLQASPPRICLITSSLASILGGITLSPLAAADAAVDAFAAQAGRLPWRSVNFEAWQVVEEGAGLVGQQQSELMLGTAEVIEALERTMVAPRMPQIIVSTGDLEARLAQWSNVLDKSDAEVAAAARTKPYRQPSNEVEAKIAEVWQEALGVQPIGLDDDFFELGGNSLVGLQILSRLRGEFQVELPLRSFFEARTVEGMARVVEAERSVDEADLARIESILQEIESLSDDDIDAHLTPGSEGGR